MFAHPLPYGVPYHFQCVSLGFAHHAEYLSSLFGPEISRCWGQVGRVWSEFSTNLCTNIRLDDLANDTEAGTLEASDDIFNESIFRSVGFAVDVWDCWDGSWILLRSTGHSWGHCCGCHFYNKRRYEVIQGLQAETSWKGYIRAVYCRKIRLMSQAEGQTCSHPQSHLHCNANSLTVRASPIRSVRCSTLRKGDDCAFFVSHAEKGRHRIQSPPLCMKTSSSAGVVTCLACHIVPYCKPPSLGLVHFFMNG